MAAVQLPAVPVAGLRLVVADSPGRTRWRSVKKSVMSLKTWPESLKIATWVLVVVIRPVWPN